MIRDDNFKLIWSFENSPNIERKRDIVFRGFIIHNLAPGGTYNLHLKWFNKKYPA